MAKNRTIQELLDIRSREKHRTRANVYFTRLPALQKAFEVGGFKKNDEILRYFPIGAVAAIESYFRAAYAEMIDAGEPYSSRIEPLVKDLRIDWRAVRAIEGKTVTSGEVIAHSLALSGLGDIQRVMNCLLDIDFLCALRSTPPLSVTRGDEEIGLERTRAEQCFKYVSRAFELRHIFAHESATSVEVDELEIFACLNWCQSFLRAAGELLSKTLDENWELSQSEMTEKAEQKLAAANEELIQLQSNLTRVLAKEGPRVQERFADIQAKWKTFADADADLAVHLWEGGSGYSMARALALEERTRQRTAQLKKQWEEWESILELV